MRRRALDYPGLREPDLGGDPALAPALEGQVQEAFITTHPRDGGFVALLAAARGGSPSRGAPAGHRALPPPAGRGATRGPRLALGRGDTQAADDRLLHRHGDRAVSVTDGEAARRRRLTCLMEQETDVINVRPRPVQCPERSTRATVERQPAAERLVIGDVCGPTVRGSHRGDATDALDAARSCGRALSRFVRGRVSPAAASRAAPRPPRVSQAPHASVSES